MKRVVIMLFQLLVTAAGLWYVFHEPQRRAQIAYALRHADLRWVLIGWICYSTVEILATVRWQILLRIQGIWISWLQAGAIVIIGLFFNQFLPGGVGGDAMRLYFIFKQAPRKKIAATLSIAMDRLFGLLTVVFLAGMSFSLRFSWLARSGPSRHIAYVALILLSASLAFVILLFWLVSHADMQTGRRTQTIYGALDAFFSALLALSGDLQRARRLQSSSFKIWNLHGIEPEILDYKTMHVVSGAYHLRPEIIESTYYLYHFTGDPQYRLMGEKLFNDFVRYCRADAGYAALADVVTKQQRDEMESFALAETFKYFYLLFAPQGTLDFNKIVFSTEAHLFRRTW
jgi:glycosyl hydrolase family 47/lysylphosphatidylglycerol synthase-like protein